MTDLLTREDISGMLKVPIRTIDYWVQTDQIPFNRLGKRLVRFDGDKIDAWLQDRENLEYRRGQSK